MINRYGIYNAALVALVLTASWWMLARAGRRQGLFLSARIGLLVVFLGYPWDFFAIRLGIWDYPNSPGAKVYGVPVNDLVFMWISTFLTTSVLITIIGREAGSERHSEREDAREQDAGDER